MKKVKLGMVAVLSTMLVATACSSGNSGATKGGDGSKEQAKQQTYEITIANAIPDSHPVNVSLNNFKKAVESESNGRIKVTISSNSALGGEVDLIQQLRSGAIQMGVLSGGPHTQIDRRFEIEELPYLFSTHEQAYEAMDGDVGKVLKGILENNGLHVLGFWENGFRNFTNNVKPIKTPEDMSGLKLRTAQVEMRQEVFKTLGANPMPIAFNELYTALQQKTVDGQENPLALIYTSKFYEVQKYLSLTNHLWGSYYFEANKGWWDKLPSDLQKIIQDNATKYGKEERQAIADGDKKLIDELKAKGMQVNEVDPAPFKAAVQPIYKKYASEFGDDLMKAIEKYTKK